MEPDRTQKAEIRTPVGRFLPALLLAAALLVAAISGCGSGDEAGSAGGGSPPDFESALADAPPALAGLYEQSGELLDGGPEAFQSRLRELRGHPVVVNKWASWCGPCRAEFPFFASQAAKRGERVAFLGVNSADDDDAARTFLADHPVPYPSYSDPESEIAQLLGAQVFPATAFYDSSGELAYLHRGGYADEGQLAADVERYAR